MVERGEVVVVVLDLGALHHPVAEPDEDVLDLAPRPGEQVEVAGADRRRARAASRRVASALSRASELAALELAPCRSSSSASSAVRAVLPAFPTGPRCSAGRARRSRAGSRSAPPCDRGSGPGPPRARRRRRRRRSPSRPPPSALRSAQASPSPLVGPDERRYPLAGDRRRRCDVERLGSGRRAESSQSARRAPVSRAAGRRARRRDRSSPACEGREIAPSSSAPPWATRATRGSGVASSRTSVSGGRRRSRPSWPEPPSARRDRRSPGRATTGAPSSAAALRTIVPDVAGIADPVEVDAEARRRCCCPATTSSTRRRGSARSRSRAFPSRGLRHSSSSLGVDLDRRRCRCRSRSAVHRARLRRPGRPRAGPRPRSRTAPCTRGVRRSASLRTSFSFSFSGLVIVSSHRVVSVIKKGGRNADRPGVLGIREPLRGHGLPG